MATYQLNLDTAFHALADPTRRAVVQRLSRGPASVSELGAPFGMARPSFLKHVTVLEQSRLIRSEKRGRTRICSLETENLVAAERWFDELRAQWASRYGKLDTLLETLKGDDHGA